MSETTTETPQGRLRACGFCPLNDKGERPLQTMAHIREHSNEATAAGTNDATDRGRRRSATPNQRARKIPIATCQHCMTKNHTTLGEALDCRAKHNGRQFVTWMTEEIAKLWQAGHTDEGYTPFMVRTVLMVEGEEKLSRPLKVTDFDPSKRTVELEVGTNQVRSTSIRNIRLINDVPDEPLSTDTAEADNDPSDEQS